MTVSDSPSSNDLLRAIGHELARIAPDATTFIPSIGVRVHTTRTPHPPVTVPLPPSLYLVFQGRKRIRTGDEDIEYGPGVMVSFAMRTPAMTEVTCASSDRPYRSLEIPFDRDTVASLCVELGLRAAPVDRIVAVDPLPPLVLDPVLRLLLLAREPQDAAALAPGVRREIWYRILTSPGDGPSMFLELVRSESVLGRIGVAVDWMHQHTHQPVDVTLIATLANMSPTSLHRHFKIATGQSPGVYHNRLRLAEARRLIIQEFATVQQAAAVVGYASPSQFTRAYRHEFGSPPSHDQRPPSPAQTQLHEPQRVTAELIPADRVVQP